MLPFARILPFAAEEAEEGSSGLDLLLPTTNELVAGIIAFSIVFFFIWRWAVPAINRSLEQRQDAIAGQIADAEGAKTEAQSLLKDYKSQLAEAKTEGNKIIEEARISGDSLKADIVAKAADEAGQIMAKARDEAASEKDRALAEARSEVGEISIDLAGKIVGETLDAKAHEELVERYLRDLEQM